VTASPHPAHDTSASHLATDAATVERPDAAAERPDADAGNIARLSDSSTYGGDNGGTSAWGL
jgi:hypothetical protein